MKYLRVLLPTACILFVGAIVYRDFLFGNAVLIYKDSGSDSINDYYPSFLHLSDYIRREGFPSWSFCLGMGQDLFYLAGYLVLEPVTWLPREFIAHALIFQHLAKTLVAGLLFFGFLECRGINAAAAALGSLLISFSAYMCMGACWYPFADEVICFVAILFVIELSLNRGAWLLLALPVAAVAFIGAFHLYLCAVFLSLYVPARLFLRYGWQPRLIVRGALVLAFAATIGAGLSAFFTLPNVYFALNSPRTSGPTSAAHLLAAFPIFGLESHLHYLTVAVRLFGNDLFGTAEAFRGWQNYLEAPLSYCGLACLILLPQLFVGANQREKIVRGLFLAGLVITTVLPWSRHLFWLFQGDYYRVLSLFSVLGIVTLSIVAFDNYSEGRHLNLWLLLATTITAVGFLFFPNEELQRRLDQSLKQEAAVFLLAYAGLLAAGHFLKRRRAAVMLIMLLSVVELALADYRTVANRKVVTKDELRMRTGYNDETIEALRDIKAADNSSFYRITKIRSSSLGVLPSLNDALVFGYYGTSYYSSFNNLNYIRFLLAVDAIPAISEIETRYSVGLLNDSMMSLFAGEKYVLTDQPGPWQRAPQYEFLQRYGPDYLFRNAYFVPLGLTFDRYLSEDDFRQLPTYAKAAVLLRTVVLQNPGDGERMGLSAITLEDLDQETRESSLEDVVATRRKTGLELTSFHQSKIEGVVAPEHKALLVVQTPFDPGWRALQDGKPAPVLKADVGLLAVAVDSGRHKIELRYVTPFRNLGLAITTGSLLILILAVRRWPRLPITPAV